MFNYNSNLQQIAALSKAKIKTERNNNILSMRIKFAKNEIKKLIDFANKNPDTIVFKILTNKASEMQKKLNAAIEG